MTTTEKVCAINNGWGELLPVDQCDFGTASCPEPVVWIISERATGYVGASEAPATAERRPMCAKHIKFYGEGTDRFAVNA